MQNPVEDTQWNDALRQHGILPQKKEAEITEEEIIKMVDSSVEERLREENRDKLEDLSLSELDLLEDEEDERVLLEYRKKRMAEMKEQAAKECFGDVLQITAADYVDHVNKAGSGIYVVLHLYKDIIPHCKKINHFMSQLAHKFPAVKFVKSVADTCIEGYPDSNLPTVFVYYEGALQEKFIGQASLGSDNLTQDQLEWMLSEAGVLRTDLECNPNKKVEDVLLNKLRFSQNEEDDW